MPKVLADRTTRHEPTIPLQLCVRREVVYEYIERRVQQVEREVQQRPCGLLIRRGCGRGRTDEGMVQHGLSRYPVHVCCCVKKGRSVNAHQAEKL
jgi:hypothetical protein